jgi:hypothetical protein
MRRAPGWPGVLLALGAAALLRCATEPRPLARIGSGPRAALSPGGRHVAPLGDSGIYMDFSVEEPAPDAGVRGGEMRHLDRTPWNPGPMGIPPP